MKALVESGLVNYFRGIPVYILAGKQSREYKYQEDSCWALVGAMELENIEVRYDISMDEIKRQFLSALIGKSQWEILLLPFPESRIKEKQDNKIVERHFKWTSIIYGAFLPVGLLVESRSAPEWTEELPKIIFSDDQFISEDLRLKEKEGHKMKVFRAPKDCITWFRHYRQDEDQPARAAFGGIIDVWGIGSEKAEISEIILDSTP